MVKRSVSDGGSDVVAVDVLPLLTLDGNPHETVIDLRASPLWGTGDTVKGELTHGRSVALGITSGDVGDEIRYVEWFYVG
jgi:hypothetical protein